MIYYGARIFTKNGYIYQTVDVSEANRDSWLQRMVLALVPEDIQQPHWEETGVRIARWTTELEGEIQQ